MIKLLFTIYTAAFIICAAIRLTEIPPAALYAAYQIAAHAFAAAIRAHKGGTHIAYGAGGSFRGGTVCSVIAS